MNLLKPDGTHYLHKPYPKGACTDIVHTLALKYVTIGNPFRTSIDPIWLNKPSVGLDPEPTKTTENIH